MVIHYMDIQSMMINTKTIRWPLAITLMWVFSWTAFDTAIMVRDRWGFPGLQLGAAPGTWQYDSPEAAKCFVVSQVPTNLGALVAAEHRAALRAAAANSRVLRPSPDSYSSPPWSELIAQRDLPFNPGNLIGPPSLFWGPSYQRHHES